MPRAPGHLPILGLWLLAAGLVVRFAILMIGAADERAHGFVGHYAASRLAVEQPDGAVLYSDSAVAAAVDRFEPGLVDIFGSNPPTVILTALPFVALEYRTARTVWTAASVILWLGAVLWLTRAVGLGWPWPPLLLCGATLFQPAVEQIRHAQFHVLVLVLVLVAWQGVRRARAPLTGAGIGTALALKVGGMAFWPLLFVHRRWRMLAWGTATAFVFVVLSLAVPGPEAWVAFIGRRGDTAVGASSSVTALQTLSGLIRRLTVFDARWNPSPLFDLGSAGIVMAWMLVAGVLARALSVARRIDLTRAFAAFAALGLALSPVSLDYHYMLAIFPAIVVLSDNHRRLTGPSGLLALGAIAMIGLDLPYRSPRLADGAAVLFAYPKLYGALILAWLLLRERVEEGATEHG